MPRSIRFEQPNDTCLFTPLQMQPVPMYRFGMATWARWLAEFIAPFPALVRDYSLGAVVVGGYADWLERCGFFDCDSHRCEGTVTVVNKRKLFSVDFNIFAVGGRMDGRQFAKGTGILRPVLVGSDPGMGAMPIPVPPQFIERLQPDEVDDARRAPRPVPDMLARLAGHTPIAHGEVPAFCSRAQSEVADQWSFIEVPALGAYGREKLIIGSGVADLRRGLREPLRSVHTEYGKPAFAFDELVVRTRAFALDDELVFVHAVHGASDGEPRATIVERF